MPTQQATTRVVMAVALLTVGALSSCVIRRDMARAEFIAFVKQEFPESSFLVGFGSGKTPEEAEERAMVDVASSIQSTISNHVRIYQTGQAAAGQKSSDFFISNETTRQVTSDVGALIQPLRERTRKIGSRYVAVAVASRKDLEGKWKLDERQLFSKVAPLWKRVVKLGASRPESVGPLLYEAECLEQRIDGLEPARFSVSKATSWTEDLVRDREASEQVRAAIRSPVQIVTDTSGRTVAEQVRIALRERSVAAVVTAEGADCSEGELQVRILPTNECTRTLGGDLRCEARLQATASRCGSQEALFSLESEVKRDSGALQGEQSGFANSVEMAILRLQGTGCRPGVQNLARAGTSARGLVAVLPPKLEGSSDAEPLRGLEETLRALAADALGPQAFDVLTAENSSVLLANRGVDPSAPLRGTALEMARAMKATHFVASVVLKEADGYVIYVRFYDSASARFLNQVTVEGNSLRELRHRLTAAAPRLFDFDSTPVDHGHRAAVAEPLLPAPPDITAERTSADPPDDSPPGERHRD